MTDGAWLPLADLLDHLQVSESSDTIARARLAAAAQVERARRDLLSEDGTTFAADADVVQGALLLASRLYARRSTPTGLASFGEFGPAAVTRFDPDVERLIGVGRYAGPAVG